MPEPSDTNTLQAKDTKPVIGRPPTVLSIEVLNEICLRMFNGESQRSICRDPHMPGRDKVNKELVENSTFAAAYARAREGLYQTWADEILEISDDGTTDFITKVGRNGHEYEAVDQEHIQRSRLRVDSRKWLLSRLLPKVYGDKVEQVQSGEVKHTVTHSLSDREKMRRMALFMLEDQAAGTVVDGELAPDSMPAFKPGKAAGRGTKSLRPKEDNGIGKPMTPNPATSAVDKE